MSRLGISARATRRAPRPGDAPRRDGVPSRELTCCMASSSPFTSCSRSAGSAWTRGCSSARTIRNRAYAPDARFLVSRQGYLDLGPRLSVPLIFAVGLSLADLGSWATLPVAVSGRPGWRRSPGARPSCTCSCCNTDSSPAASSAPPNTAGFGRIAVSTWGSLALGGRDCRGFARWRDRARDILQRLRSKWPCSVRSSWSATLCV